MGIATPSRHVRLLPWVLVSPTGPVVTGRILLFAAVAMRTAAASADAEPVSVSSAAEQASAQVGVDQLRRELAALDGGIVAFVRKPTPRGRMHHHEFSGATGHAGEKLTPQRGHPREKFGAQGSLARMLEAPLVSIHYLCAIYDRYPFSLNQVRAFLMPISIGVWGRPSSFTAFEQSYHSVILPIRISPAVKTGGFLVIKAPNSKTYPSARAR